MQVKELEFRGIPLQHLGMYIEELGGKKVSDEFPIIYHGEGWSVHIVSEEEISFTAVFKVNSIHIRFMSEKQDVLEELVNKYRKKTFRAGG